MLLPTAARLSLTRTMQCGLQRIHRLQVQSAVPSPVLPLLGQTPSAFPYAAHACLNRQLLCRLDTRAVSSSAGPTSTASSSEQGQEKQSSVHSKNEAFTSNGAKDHNQSGSSATISGADASSVDQTSPPSAHVSSGVHAIDNNSAIAPSNPKPVAGKTQGASAIKGRRPTFDELMATLKPELKAMCLAEGLRGNKRTKAQLSQSLLDKWNPPPTTRQKRKDYKKTRKKAKNEKKKLQAAAGIPPKQPKKPASKPKALGHDPFWDG